MNGSSISSPFLETGLKPWSKAKAVMRSCLMLSNSNAPVDYTKCILSSTTFQRRMSRFPQRWRTQRNAIRNANCKTSWIIKILNAHCAFGIFPEACLSEFLWNPLCSFAPFWLVRLDAFVVRTLTRGMIIIIIFMIRNLSASEWIVFSMTRYFMVAVARTWWFLAHLFSRCNLCYRFARCLT